MAVIINFTVVHILWVISEITKQNWDKHEMDIMRENFFKIIKLYFLLIILINLLRMFKFDVWQDTTDILVGVKVDLSAPLITAPKQGILQFSVQWYGIFHDFIQPSW